MPMPWTTSPLERRVPVMAGDAIEGGCICVCVWDRGDDGGWEMLWICWWRWLMMMMMRGGVVATSVMRSSAQARANGFPEARQVGVSLYSWRYHAVTAWSEMHMYGVLFCSVPLRCQGGLTCRSVKVDLKYFLIGSFGLIVNPPSLARRSRKAWHPELWLSQCVYTPWRVYIWTSGLTIF